MPQQETIADALRAYVDGLSTGLLGFLIARLAGTSLGVLLELQQIASGIGLGAWGAIAKFHQLASA